ncbi:glycosyltransferase family 2 protein [Negativibacillus massiliensis]|uniref:glycosyltransferase family 2 protein n=1 Tax=Negativibacillus massiliensis TaxID=1871035 RepID=UPI003AF992BF
MEDCILKINLIVFITLTIFYLYQFIYVAVVLFKKHKERQHTLCPFHRYGVVIAARNESMVIGNLIRSIQNQTYPSKLIDIFVVADNCTDNTAQIARQLGAVVYERFNKEQVGKGYALDFAFRHIAQDYGANYHDAYLIFDADNLLDSHYIDEMNVVFSQGYQIITSYRNSKNFSTNWITAGYSLWFLREAKYLNNARMMLGTNCAISGTGFLLSSKVVQKYGGWKFHLLTEDIEFSIVNAIEGERIGYCGKAILYDEQPTTFRQSWTQRLRWSKGFYQVIWKYGTSLISKLVKDKRHPFSCYDMFMTIAPATLVSLGCLILNIIFLIIAIIQPHYLGDAVAVASKAILFSFVNFYIVLFAMGALTTITEWHQIKASTVKKIFYTFTFPIFIFTYIPISIVALFKNVQWTPIVHTVSKSVEEMK